MAIGGCGNYGAGSDSICRAVLANTRSSPTASRPVRVSAVSRREEPPAQGVTSSFSHSRTIAPVTWLVGPSRFALTFFPRSAEDPGQLVNGLSRWLKSQGFCVMPEQVLLSRVPGQPPLSRWIAQIDRRFMLLAWAKFSIVCASGR
jgi:hypothetical protein